MDLVQDKNVSPKMIVQVQKPFDNSEWSYELEMDGYRCIASSCILDGELVVMVNGVSDFYEL